MVGGRGLRTCGRGARAKIFIRVKFVSLFALLVSFNMFFFVSESGPSEIQKLANGQGSMSSRLLLFRRRHLDRRGLRRDPDVTLGDLVISMSSSLSSPHDTEEAKTLFDETRRGCGGSRDFFCFCFRVDEAFSEDKHNRDWRLWWCRTGFLLSSSSFKIVSSWCS